MKSMGLQQHACNYTKPDKAFICSVIVHTLLNPTPLSDCSHPTALYVLGNLTEKINFYDNGGMGWRFQVFVLPVFFSKVTVK